jgi:hypothetical protein
MNNPVRFTETGRKYSLIVDFYMANQKVLGKKKHLPKGALIDCLF